MKCSHIWIGETPELLKQTGGRRVLRYRMTCPKCGYVKARINAYERLARARVPLPGGGKLTITVC